MTDPETCGDAGGAISIWLRDRAGFGGAYLTTRRPSASTGITIYYLGGYIM